MDHVQQQPRRPSGRGALGWTVFLLIALLATAAVIAGAIRAGLSPSPSQPPGALPSLSDSPSPAPTPLPKPGPAPPRTELAAP
jgi:hypothetical protein